MRTTNHRRLRAGAGAPLGTLALLVIGTLALLAIGMRGQAAAAAAGRVERIELKTEGASTKVIVMLSRPIAFDVKVLDGDPAKKIGRRLVLDFADATLAPEATRPIEVANDLLRQVRPGQFNATTARIVLDLASTTAHSVDAFEAPPHVTISLAGATTGGSPSTTTSTTGTAPVAAPEPAAAAAVDAPASAAADAAKAPSRSIPIRARGRRPYSLNYSR